MTGLEINTDSEEGGLVLATNIWESIMEAVVHQLAFLIVPDDPKYPTDPDPNPHKGSIRPTGRLQTFVRPPQPDFNTPILKVEQRASYEYDVIKSTDVPALFVSFGNSRLDPSAQAELNDFVEQVGIQIEVVLHDGAGRAKPGSNLDLRDVTVNESLPLSQQVPQVRDDLQKLLAPDQINMAVEFPRRTNIRDAKIVEWGPNYSYRGSPQEVIIFLLQVTAVYDR